MFQTKMLAAASDGVIVEGGSSGVEAGEADFTVEEGADMLDDSAFDLDPEAIRKHWEESAPGGAPLSDVQVKAFQASLRGGLKKHLADNGRSLRHFRSKVVRKV